MGKKLFLAHHLKMQKFTRSYKNRQYDGLDTSHSLMTLGVA